ncbi:MAG: CHAT domain-containing protein [Lyngbya sp.]|nr:CHAT domain-containing protein [Lyngbya sp.]
MMKKEKIKILILTVNPKNTEKLRLDEEVREIQSALEQASYREQFEVMARWAVRVDDLQAIVLNHPSEIIHFSGHGVGEQGLALENESGQTEVVSTDALAGLFKLLENTVECVVLNACHSEEQAEAIHRHINCVIGMNRAIGDKAAINFARGFYRALGAGKFYDEAFAYGCNAIDLKRIPETSTPTIKCRQRLVPGVEKQPISEQSVPPQQKEMPPSSGVSVTMSAEDNAKQIGQIHHIDSFTM